MRNQLSSVTTLWAGIWGLQYFFDVTEDILNITGKGFFGKIGDIPQLLGKIRFRLK